MLARRSDHAPIRSDQNGSAVARALAVTIVDMQVLTQTLTPSSDSDR